MILSWCRMNESGLKAQRVGTNFAAILGHLGPQSVLREFIWGSDVPASLKHERWS